MSAPPPGGAHRIDVHHHVLPASYLADITDLGVEGPGVNIRFPTWDVDTDLDVMDRNGIQSAVVSITVPGVGPADRLRAIRIARGANDYLAQLIADHPTRYGAFALLPLPDVDAALREIDRALEIGLDGIGLFTHYRGTYLGDPAFAAVFAKLAETGAVAHIHPAAPPASDQPAFGLPPSLYEFPFDTTRTIANLLYSGTLDRHPNLQLIVSHAGGAAPYLAQRLTYASTITPSLRDRDPKDLMRSLRSLYYDTAMSANPHTLAGLSSLIGADHILFGTDFPFMPESTTADTVAGVTAFFDHADLALIERSNALALFPRIARAGSHSGAEPSFSSAVR